MTETKDITRESETENKETTDSGMNPSEKTRIINQAKERTQKGKVEDVQVVEVRCTKAKRDRYTLDIHHPNGKSNVNIRKALQKEKAEEFIKEYKMGSKAYMTVFSLNYRGENRTFIADLNSEYQDAVKVKNNIINSTNKYDQMPFRFSEGTKTIRFGKEHKYRSYLPSFLDKDSFKISRDDKTSVVLYSIIYVLGTLLLFSGVPFLVLFGLITYLIGIILAYAGYRIGQGTYMASTIDVKPELLKNDLNQDITVEKLRINNSDDQIVFEWSEKDVTWTFEKGEFGDIEEDAQEVLEIGEKQREVLFTPISESKSYNRGIKSDCGEYVVPIL